MVYGLFGNEVNLLVNVDSGDILWEKKVELFGSDHALTKPDLSIASLSLSLEKKTILQMFSIRIRFLQRLYMQIVKRVVI